METVLLVQPKRYKYELISLMKFSTYYKEKGYNIIHRYGINPIKDMDINPSIICYSSIFTTDYPLIIKDLKLIKNMYQKSEIKLGGVSTTLLHDKIYNRTGIKPHIGLYDEIELIKPDFSLFMDIDYSITSTSRGCIRKCLWCPVHINEPTLIEYNYEKWIKNIDYHKKTILFFDNNFLGCSKEHIFNTIDKISTIDKNFDFNQSLDCRLFTEEIADKFSKIGQLVKPMRFSFDLSAYKDEIEKAVKLCHKYKISNAYKNEGRGISVDVLFNFKDTPEDAYNRVEFLRQINAEPFVMCYIPLDWIEPDKYYISSNWTRNKIIAFKNYYSAKNIYRSCTFEEFLNSEYNTNLENFFNIKTDIKRDKKIN